METIVDLAERRERIDRYAETVEEARRDLEAIGECIMSHAFDLAIRGPWYEWEKTVPVGTSHCFSPEVLRECRDANVRTLVDLFEHIDSISLTTTMELQ